MIKIKILGVFVLVWLSVLMFIPGAFAPPLIYEMSLNGIHVGIETGLIGGTLRGFDETGINLSYDMATFASAGVLDDFTTNANDGHMDGVTNGTGFFGNTVHFDGVDDFVRAFDSDSLDLINDVTLAMWVSFTPGGIQMLMTKSNNNEFETYSTAGDLVWNSGDGTTETLTFGAGLSGFALRHIAYTKSGQTVTVYVNGTQAAAPQTLARTVTASTSDFELGTRDGTGFFLLGDFHQALAFNRSLSASEIADLADRGQDYDFRFDNEALVPSDLSVNESWLMGSNLTFGIQNVTTITFDPIAFTANASVWFESGVIEGLAAISWDSFSNVTGANIDFNFTVPTGTYPYWVNNTHQTNLTTVAGAIAFGWEDWLDGEHLFELGIEFTSTPITTGTSGSFYSYPATVTKTSVTWFCVLCPPWGTLSAAGVLSGTPIGNGNFPVTLQANTTGLVTIQQSFTVIVSGVPIPPSLTNTGILFMIGFIPFLVMIGIGFWKEQGALIIVGGIAGVLLGLWVIFALQDFGNTQFFGVIFVGIGILFSYVGWVNIDRSG